MLVVVDRCGSAVHAHLVTLGPDRAQGATLFLGLHVAGDARRALRLRRRHRRAHPDEPRATSLSTVLPAFKGYAVLSLSV